MGKQDDSLDGLRKRVKALEDCQCELGKDVTELENVTGATGTFTTVDLKTVTVVNGIITSIEE